MPIRTIEASELAQNTLAVLYQHRLVASHQLARLLTPEAASHRYMLHLLKHLERKGLADRVVPPGRRPHRWFLTPVGARAVQEADEVLVRPYRMSPERAAGPLAEHMLAVVETGLAFFEHARLLGDDFEPLYWVPEVAHRYVKGNGRFNDTHVISDALLHYVINGSDGVRWQIQFLVEVDRATMPVHRLAGKLVSYARYFDFHPLRKLRSAADGPARPAWQERYPRFPRVLLVLDGANKRRLANRRTDLAAYVRSSQYLIVPRPGFSIGCATMPDLVEQGPRARIWRNLVSEHEDEQRTDFALGAGPRR
ncbi:MULTISPECIES: replication-relaxation family protein [unclassified Nocardiopsis]|uniref:replication-relaxation family protein n=1 Tax=unclassified Nocardiopsis TaxID=2649073 RepID=UPI001357F35D|nr:MULTISPECIES: replication-relaxation family protein [unclassified Nocardiopsis]